MLRVFGRLPVTDSATRSRAGVRKASGEETAGEFAPAVEGFPPTEQFPELAEAQTLLAALVQSDKVRNAIS